MSSLWSQKGTVVYYLGVGKHFDYYYVPATVRILFQSLGSQIFPKILKTEPNWVVRCLDFAFMLYLLVGLICFEVIKMLIITVNLKYTKCICTQQKTSPILSGVQIFASGTNRTVLSFWYLIPLLYEQYFSTVLVKVAQPSPRTRADQWFATKKQASTTSPIIIIICCNPTIIFVEHSTSSSSTRAALAILFVVDAVLKDS